MTFLKPLTFFSMEFSFSLSSDKSVFESSNLPELQHVIIPQFFNIHDLNLNHLFILFLINLAHIKY